MENLSMSGETELEDYYEMKINLESQEDLDYEIQAMINNEACEELSQTSKPSPDRGVHYRTDEFVPSRRMAILSKNKVIMHRNKLVRQARENGKFYLEGGVLSMQQSSMFMYDQSVLKSELKQLQDRNSNSNSASFKSTEQTINSMILKLDQIQNLNNQAKKNDIFKEKLHQTLRDYLSWKNQIFKQNFIQNLPSEVDYSKLFNCNKNGDKDDSNDPEKSMDRITSKNQGGGEPLEKNSENSIQNEKARNQATRQGGNRKGKFSFDHDSRGKGDQKTASKKEGMMLTESDIPAKEIKLAKILMDKPAPHCSAQSWAIYDQKSHTLMFGKNEKERREVASITKIMTCYVTLQLMEKFNKNDETLIEVSANASSVHGTSADLLEGDTLTI
jgi:hypothetical protein